MKHTESGSGRVILMAAIALIGAATLLIFPTLAPGIWKIVAWLVAGGAAVAGGMFYQKEQQQKTLEAKEDQKRRYQRSKRLKEDKENREKKIESSRKNLAKKEEKQDEKRAKVKTKVIKEAKVVWSGRVDHAKEQETKIRQVINKTDIMPIREAAGNVAIEWNEATTLSLWTMEQIDMFARLPDSTKKAREEAQDAIIESIKVKDAGGLWTAEQGKALADKKEKARQEAMTEEKRVDNMRDTLVNADIKWRAVERRVERWMEELAKIYKNYAKLKE